MLSRTVPNRIPLNRPMKEKRPRSRPNRKDPIPLPPTTTTVPVIPLPRHVKRSTTIRVHGLLSPVSAFPCAGRGRVDDRLATDPVSDVQHPPHQFAPVGFVQEPVLPFGAQHFTFDRVDDAHGDEKVVAVGAEGLAGALEATGGGAGWAGGVGWGVRGVRVG